MTRLHALLLFPILFFLANDTSARHACADNRQHSKFLSTAKTAIDPALEQYDVKYVKLDLAMSHLNTSFSGNAITRGVVTSSSGMGKYVFELNDKITIDSIRFNGALLSYTTPSTDLKSVTLPLALSNGASFTAQVFYRGTAAGGSGFFTHALNHYVQPSGTNITYSLSDPYLAKEWWPCKQSLTDKIDSADLWFTIPAGTKAGSNGKLMAVTPGGTTNRYEWKTRYPIDYYLISVAIAPYIDRTQMVHFSGSTDSMPVQHYVYDSALFIPQNGAAIDSTPYMVDYFSTLYGRYPFWQEKYGHCIAPLSGGMEHQTMTTLGAFTTPLIAHELGHQWWGNHVTYTSWKDIWLSEGFASYTEQLYVEHFHSVAEAKAYRTGVFNRVMGGATGSVYVDDTTNVYRIFDSRLTYDKGAAVSHMLRYIAPSDSIYFAGLRSYQQRYAFRTATTDSFRAVMEAAYGRPLDTFFNQWIYGQGFPTYGGSWNQAGDDVFVQLTQSTSAPTYVSAFAMPLVLQLKSASGDTLVTVFLNNAQQLYSFKWSKTMTGFTIDPQDQVVNGTRGTLNDPTLSVPGMSWKERLKISPNPSSDSWSVVGLPPASTVQLHDLGGRLLWEQHNASGNIQISSRYLPAGIYTLQVTGNGKSSATFKLERR